MENQTKAQAHALEPKLGNAASPASRRAVVQLSALPPALKNHRLMCYAEWDLGNLVRCALAAGAPANARLGEDNAPVVCFAAQEGAARSLKVLLTGGADPWLADNKSRTALYWAAWKGDVACLTLLLNAGASLETKNLDGRTPLAIAADVGHPDAVAALLQRGANANQTNKLGLTPLMSAIGSQHARCCELLLPHSNLSVTNFQGFNALHACVLTASYDCFKLLLPRVDDVDARTVAGITAAGAAQSASQTALHLACAKGLHKMVEKLLRRGASRTARDGDQRTPLHHAVMAGQQSCVVQLIGQPEAYKLAPADVDAADDKGRTPLHYAAQTGHTQICGLLLAAGARLDARMSSGHTPLLVAEQFHPGNAALLAVLAGGDPGHSSGALCDGCGCHEDPASPLMPCAGCQVACYCSAACQRAAWAAHKTECRRLKAELEHEARNIAV